MKKLFIAASFILAMTLMSAETVPAENMEPINNPTLKDLQGKWDGTSRLPFRGVFYSAVTKRYGKPVVMIFDGAKARYSSEDAHFDADVKIAGEEITMTSGRRTDICKLNNAADTMVLDCKFEVAAAEDKRGYSGTMHLEKKR